MSKAQALIETLTIQGLELWADGEQLRYRGPKSVLTPELLFQLKQHKAEILACLATTTYPATWEQQSNWAVYQAAAQKTAEHMAFAARLSGPLDEVAFQRAWQTLMQRHTTLRTTYRPEGKSTDLEQYNHASQHEPMLLATVRGGQGLSVNWLGAENWHEEELQAQLAAHHARPFDLTQGPLLRVSLFVRSPREHILLVTAPRITLDGSSLARLLDEFRQLYLAAQSDAFVTLPSPGATPADYAVWQAGQRSAAASNDPGHDMAPEGEYVLNLPHDYPRHAQQGQCTAQQRFELSAVLTAQLNQLAAQTETTLATVLLTAFQVLLYRYTGQTNLAIRYSVTPYHRCDFRGLLGGFTAEAAVHTVLAEQNPSLITFADLLHSGQQLRQAVETPSANAPKANAAPTAFQVAFRLDRTPWVWEADAAATWGQLEVTPFILAHTPDTVELSLVLAEVDERITGAFYYRSDLFAPVTVTRMVGHWQTILAGIVETPGQAIGLLPWLTREERQQILIEWNNTATDYPKDKCIQQLFEEQAARTPDAPAVLFDSSAAKHKVEQPATLTYQELNQRANQLAHYLQTLGVGSGSLVGICVERSPLMIVGLLGILKAGGAYVPLDPAYPHERLAFMLQDASVTVLLTQEHLSERLRSLAATQFVALDSDWPQIAQCGHHNLIRAVRSHDLAYVLYTSGSTGQPKGVMIEHRSPAALIDWGKRVYSQSELTGVLASTSICFDLSVYEIFLPLSVGGQIILAENALHLPEIRYKQQVTLINTVPSSIEELLRHQAIPTSVQTINLAGEPLRSALVDKLYALPSVQKVYDLYGPSEDTTYSTFKLREQGGPATIGKPIDNTQVYILDPHLQQPLPVGVIGELHIGGIGLARGYLHRPELTAQKFIPNPFGPPEDPGRLYKTGDLARWLPDGNIEFLGRMDNQVKLRGFRIELGEIESVLTEHPVVQEAVVVAQETTSGYKQLTAYVVPKLSQTSDIELWPSMPEHDIYDDFIYYTLTSDERRNQSYQVALSRVAKDKTVVEIGTGQDALLAVFCVQAGAKKVYGIEIDFAAYQKAVARVQELGLQDQIEIIYGDATQIELPELVDVCVSGIVGPIGGAQGAAVIINHAQRFLKPNGVMIPERCITKIAAVTLPDEIRRHPQFTALSGRYVQKIFDQIGYPFDLRLCIRKFPKANLLSTVEVFEDLDFKQQIELDAIREINLAVNRTGRIDGFLVWMQMHLCEGEVIDILEGEYVPMPVYFPVFEPGIAVAQGDVVHATCLRTLSDNRLNPDYVLDGRLLLESGQTVEFQHGSYHHKPQFKQTSFYERLFTAGSLIDTAADQRSTPSALTTQLRQHMATKLPDYMLPAAFVLLDALPLTPNGKVDRRALPAPANAAVARPTEIAAPNNPIEAVIAQIWCEALNRSAVGIHDAFMELGGHSLLAMQIVAKIESIFHVQLPLNRFFAASTVSELAQTLVKYENKPGQMTRLARLQQRLNQLSTVG